MEYHDRYRTERVKEVVDTIHTQSYWEGSWSLFLNLNRYENNYPRAWENFREQYEDLAGYKPDHLFYIELTGGRVLITRKKPVEF